MKFTNNTLLISLYYLRARVTDSGCILYMNLIIYVDQTHFMLLYYISLQETSRTRINVRSLS